MVDDKLMDTKMIAKVFDVSVRRVEQLTHEGIIVPAKTRPRKYDPYPTIRAYIQYLSDKAYGREKKQSKEEYEISKLEADARWKQAKAEMAELDLQELQGEMHRAEDVEAITTNIVFAVRSFLLAMPNRLAIDVYSAKSKTQVSEVIKKEIYQILEQLANLDYDKADYKKLVRERKGLREDEDDL